MDSGNLSATTELPHHAKHALRTTGAKYVPNMSLLICAKYVPNMSLFTFLFAPQAAWTSVPTSSSRPLLLWRSLSPSPLSLSLICPYQYVPNMSLICPYSVPTSSSRPLLLWRSLSPSPLSSLIGTY